MFRFNVFCFQVSKIHHPNISKFYGVAFPDVPPVCHIVITENCSRGLLRKYVDQTDLDFNWDLRFSLIWDLIAVRFIYGSAKIGPAGLREGFFHTMCIISLICFKPGGFPSRKFEI